MAEPFDVYVDQVLMAMNPHGASLTFQLSPAQPPQPGAGGGNAPVGTIRMSLEHLKLMTFMLKSQVDQTESQLGIVIPVSRVVLNGLHIGPEDWERFWKRD